MLDANEDFVLLDVRNVVDANKFWIASPKRLSIILDELPDRYSEIPRNKKVIILDVNGKRSPITASYLAGKGYTDLVRLNGGMQQWAMDGMPVEQGK